MFLRPGGYAEVIGADAGVVRLSHGQRIFFCNEIGKMDTFTCFHNNEVVHVPAKCDPAEMGGVCKICMKLICKECVAKGGCTPFEKKLEAWRARTEALRSYGM